MKFQNMACIYMWREENSNNNSHPKLNMCIFLYLYFEMKRLPRYPHLSPLQHEIEPPLSSFPLYRALLAKERNPMHRNILLRVSYLLQRAVTLLLRIFKGTFFTIEKDTTKSLGLRRIKTSANDETKMAANFENRFWSESKFFFAKRHCFMCRFGWENKKIRVRKITLRGVSGVKISFAAN